MGDRDRGYCFTLNNYTAQEVDEIKLTSCRYIIFGKEIAPSTGTPHLQGYVYFKDKISMKGIHKIQGWSRTALKSARGTADQNETYCKKEGIEIYERGIKPEQGKRNDLDRIYSDIKNGVSVDEIILSDPGAYQLAGRAMERLEDIILRNKRRTEMTLGEWIFGPSGVGKSEYAFSHPNAYVYANDGGWWDGYRGEDVVIIDEFRGQIAFNELLRMVDKHPNYYVRRRGREPMPFISKKVIITSALPPWKVYKALDAEDSLGQLYRRFAIYKIDKHGELNHIDPESEHE